MLHAIMCKQHAHVPTACMRAMTADASLLLMSWSITAGINSAGLQPAPCGVHHPSLRPHRLTATMHPLARRMLTCWSLREVTSCRKSATPLRWGMVKPRLLKKPTLDSDNSAGSRPGCVRGLPQSAFTVLYCTCTLCKVSCMLHMGQTRTWYVHP